MIKAVITHPDILQMERYGELNPKEAVCTCDMCGEDIYEGEDYYQINNDNICKFCINDFRKTAEFEI